MGRTTARIKCLAEGDSCESPFFYGLIKRLFLPIYIYKDKICRNADVEKEYDPPGCSC